MKDATIEEREAIVRKIDKLERLNTFISTFTNFITEDDWSERFDTSLKCYQSKLLDPNLALFMDI